MTADYSIKQLPHTNGQPYVDYNNPELKKSMREIIDDGFQLISVAMATAPAATPTTYHFLLTFSRILPKHD